MRKPKTKDHAGERKCGSEGEGVQFDFPGVLYSSEDVLRARCPENSDSYCHIASCGTDEYCGYEEGDGKEAGHFHTGAPLLSQVPRMISSPITTTKAMIMRPISQ